MIDWPNTIVGGGTEENVCGTAKWGVSIPNATYITPTFVPPESTAPPTPVPTKPTFCYDNKKWKNHGPVNGDTVNLYVDEACRLWKDTDVLSISSGFKYDMKWIKSGNWYTTYNYAIFWRTTDSNCMDPATTGKRVAMDVCKDLLYRAWKDCKSKSRIT